MTTKYLEIDSTYRDRSTWPLQGRFQVLLSQQSAFPASTAVDPVSTATPQIEWQSNRFQANSFGSVFVSGTVISVGAGANNTPFTVVFSSPPGQLSSVANYYRHAVMTAPVNLESRIVSYEYLGDNKAQVTLLGPLNIAAGTMITITDATDLSVLRLFVPTSPLSIDNFYAGQILYDETVNAFANITFFNSLTGEITVDAPIVGWLSTDSFSIRRQAPILVGVILPSTPSNISLGPNGDRELIGSFLRIRPVYPPIGPGGEIRRIVAYDPATFMATVNPPFNANPTTFEFELLPFSYDNFNPFVFIGTAQNELVTCSVKLVNLTLPSVILNTGYGGTAQDYAYLYVQLTPINTINSNIASSNNPKAISSLFRATRSHSSGQDTRFINFDGNKQRQKVKFKVETDFNFSVTLPTGQTFETLQTDTVSPAEPNPLLQISALFEIVRE